MKKHEKIMVAFVISAVIAAGVLLWMSGDGPNPPTGVTAVAH